MIELKENIKKHIDLLCERYPALKIVEDFRLPIEIKGNKELSEQDRERIRRERTRCRFRPRRPHYR